MVIDKRKYENVYFLMQLFVDMIRITCKTHKNETESIEDDQGDLINDNLYSIVRTYWF